jgi:BirA family biotin operon repressor/biotin-[acetyl-CoA-carboxylase] ligase
MFDPLPADLAAGLAAAATHLGPYANVHYLAAVESTNDIALSMAASGAAEGTSVVADVQRHGRGRRGHAWFSPPGAGLYVSIVVRPEMSGGAPPLLTLGAGVAMAEAVTDATGLPVELKWPNDLVIGRPWRKLGGVLCETVTASGKIAAVVVGIGLNVRPVALPASLAGRATSIEDELGRVVDRDALLVALLARMRAIMDRLHAGDRGSVTAAWRQFARRGLGATVRWADARGDHRGVASDIDEDGALIVVTREEQYRVMAGDVIWEDVPGE